MSVKIISGKWQRKSIDFIDAPGLRPTPNRVRETLFNWLAFELAGASVLDLFAGSGILAFEALSRGAKSASLVEFNPSVYQQLLSQKKSLNAQDANIINQDAIVFLDQAYAQNADYIFLDPPFGKFDLSQLLQSIVQKNHLKSTGKIYLESASPLSEIKLPDELQFYKQKKAASVHYGLLNTIFKK